MKKFLYIIIYTLAIMPLFLRAQPLPPTLAAGYPVGFGPVSNNIKYVDASKADDSGNGLSWASAKKTLQAAIDISVSGDQIWIKTGTYIPTVAAGGSGTRYKTFTLKDGLAIYGGFAGTETNLTQRVVKNNPTILSGDLNGDDDYTANPWTNITENVYHVIYMPGALNLTSTVILDGLIISGGNANETLKGGLHAIYGGGMYFEGSPTTQNAIAVNNCILRNNYATSGGAIYTVIPPGGGSIVPTFTNCLMYSNKAVNGGAYAGSGFCQLYFNSCSFTENTAVTNGGAIYSIGYSMQFFYNSIFWNNTASVGKQFYIAFPAGKSSGGCNLTNCCYAYGANDVIVSPVDYTFLFNSTNGITTDPQFIDPTTADYRIFGTSPCVNAGVNDHNTETKDLRGETRVQNTTIDIGAYEWTSGTDPAANCQDAITVTNNNSSGAGSLRQALLDLCEGGTISLNVAVEWPANITITQNLTLDLHGYTVSNTGNYTALIDEGKAVGIKNTASGGSFNAKIAFSSTSSKLALYTENVLGSGFSVSASSAASGLLQIGDGTVAINHTYTVSDLKFNGKISKILVKSSSNLIFNPAIGKK